MAEFTIPEVGEGIDSGTIVGILVAVGDTVEKDQPLLEMETDKAVVEVPSDTAGTVSAIHVSEGDEVQIGQVVLSLGEAGSAAAESQETAPETATATDNIDGGSVEAITLPEVGEGIETGTVIGVLVKVGDSVAVDDTILELETDKAVVEMPSPLAGVIESLNVSEGEEAQIGQVVATIRSSGAASVQTENKATASETTTQTPAVSQPTDSTASPSTASHSSASNTRAPEPYVTGAKTVAAAPSVRRLARELGVDIQQVAGSGTLGRISAADVERVAQGGSIQSISQASAVGGGVPAAFRKLPDFSKYGETRREPMSAVRRATARQMETAWNVPRVTHHDKADITDLEILRKSYQKRVERAGGGKLTPTAILAKIVAAALQVFPELNASVDMDAQEIIYKDYINLGIAVDTPRGLLVPNIKAADQKNIIEISTALNELADKARKGKTSLDDMQGSTFTITNLGGIGGTSFTPVVNHPEVGILGVSRGRYEPIYDHETGEFSPRMMMPLSLSYDHRLVDGALAARFTRWICEALESPLLVLLEG